MQYGVEPGERINSFALVSYIPDPLGTFLNRLRTELVRGCVARSHATILPPRTLKGAAEEAAGTLQQQLADFPPFVLELTDIEVFASTSVIYLGVSRGRREMRQLHDRLNTGPLAFDEPYPFHPHVTLAQDFDPAAVSEMYQRARAQWANFTGPRHFDIDVLTFVQNTSTNCWLDLEEFQLREPAVIHAG